MPGPEVPSEEHESGASTTDYGEMQREAQAEEVSPDADLQAPEVATTDTSTPERSKSAEELAQERFMLRAFSTVPRDVMLSTLRDVGRDAQRAGHEVDLNVMSTQLGEALKSDNLGLSPKKLEELAGRTKRNGFQESGGGIWQQRPDARSPLGKTAYEARSIVKDTVSGILGF